MKSKIHKILGIGLVFTLLAGLIVSAVPVSAETLYWSAERTVSTSNKILEADTINDIAVASDNNTVYAALTTNKLYKSTNLGATWTALTWTVAADLVAVAPDDPDTIAVVSGTTVYISTNGGTKFDSLGIPENTAGTVPMTGINDIDISRASGGINYVACGGIAAGGAALCYMNFGASVPDWTEAAIDDWNNTVLAVGPTTDDEVWAIAFSPSFHSDKTIAAVTADSTAEAVRFHLGSFSTKRWNTGYASAYPIALTVDAATCTAADISISSDFLGGDETTRNAFVAITVTDGTPAGVDCAPGALYRIKADVKKELRDAVGFQSVSFNTSAEKVVAGASASNSVYRSTNPMDSSPTVAAATTYKRPGINPDSTPTSLTTNVIVAWAGDTAVAGSGGTDGAFSVSYDDGKSWNDISLVNTAAIVNILDVAVSADGSTIYMLCDDAAGDISLWRKQSGSWARVFDLPNTSSVSMVRLDPADASVVYLADAGANDIYYSDDAGEASWRLRYSSGTIVDLAVESAEVIYVLAGTSVYKSEDAGFVWGAPKSTKLASAGFMLSCVAEDMLVAGDTGGQVAYSTDGNSSWTTFTTAPFTSGNVSVTADPDMEFIYAGTSTVAQNIVRWEVGVSTKWDDIYAATLATNDAVSGIAYSDGALYVISCDSVAATPDSTLHRTISPTSPKNLVSWSTILATAGSSTLVTPEFKDAPQALKISSGSNKVWTIDITGTADKLCSIVDTIYNAGPVLSAPADLGTVPLNPITGHAYDVAYNWSKPSDNVTAYDLWIAFDSSFNEIVRKESAITSTSSTVVFVLGPYTSIPGTSGGSAAILEYMPGTTYYWKVRVASTGPLASPWSATRSFTVGSAGATMEFKAELMAPAAGATNVPINPTFMWAEVEGAVTYELEVSDNSAFRGVEKDSPPLVQRAGITNNVFVLEEDLDYATSYYWRVRPTTTAAARPTSEGEAGEWTVGVFTTMPEPVDEEPVDEAPEIVIPPAQEITPGWIYAIIAIGAILVIAVLVLIVRTRRVV